MSTRALLLPEAAQFKTTAFPEFGQTNDTSGARKYLGFATDVEESCYWTFIAPQGMTGALTAVITYAMASATTGDLICDVAIEALTALDAIDTDAAESLDTVNTSAASTVPGTAGYIGQISITLTNADSATVADMLRLRFRRAISNVLDTAAADMNVYAIEFRDAA